MSNNYLDYTDSDESDGLNAGDIGLGSWLGATIVIYLVGPGLTLSILFGCVVAAGVFAALLVWPGNATLDVDGVELGAPGEWGWIDDEEVSE